MNTGMRHTFGRSKGLNLPITPEYQAVLDKAIELNYSLPTEEQNEINNKIIIDLKNSNNWDEIELFYYFQQSSLNIDFCKINWKDPDNFILIANGGSPNFINNKGFAYKNGFYLDTQYTPSIDAVRSQIGDTSMFFKRGSINGFVTGTRNGAQNWNLSITNVIYIYNSTNGGGVSYTANQQLQSVIDNGTNIEYYKNNNLISTTPSENKAKSTHPLTIGCLNNNGTKAFSPYTDELRFFGCGSANVNIQGLAEALPY